MNTLQMPNLIVFICLSQGNTRTGGVYMEKQKEIYELGNGQFMIQRSFGTQQTVPQILAREITSGLLQSGVLKSADGHGIIQP